MTINYKQLEALVREAMFTGGGINEPSAPEGIPVRMPAADTQDKEQDMGDEDANNMYDIALVAREAVEKLVEALDEPIYDAAYEHAFKASACMRRVLNSLEEVGAHPMPVQRVVAPPAGQQKYSGGANAGDYAGGAGGWAMGDGFGLSEAPAAAGVTGLGTGVKSSSQRAAELKDKAAAELAAAGTSGVEKDERAMLSQIENIFNEAAAKVDLTKYASWLKTMLTTLLKKVEAELERQGTATQQQTLPGITQELNMQEAE